jgi:hypothetical protein
MRAIKAVSSTQRWEQRRRYFQVEDVPQLAQTGDRKPRRIDQVQRGGSRRCHPGRQTGQGSVGLLDHEVKLRTGPAPFNDLDKRAATRVVRIVNHRRVGRLITRSMSMS